MPSDGTVPRLATATLNPVPDRHIREFADSTSQNPHGGDRPQTDSEPAARAIHTGRSAGGNHGRARPSSTPAHLTFPASGQEAGTLGEVHGLGPVRGPELLVDVLDVGLHRRTTDAQAVADRGQRPVRREEGQDGRLGRRQMNRRARCSAAGRSGLTGHASDATPAAADLSSAKVADILAPESNSSADVAEERPPMKGGWPPWP